MDDLKGVHKAISLTQPWATLMQLGEKRWETRSWPTSHRGPLAIAASKHFPRECRELCWQEPFKSVLCHAGFRLWSDLPLGCIIAVVDVVDCLPTEACAGFQRLTATMKTNRNGMILCHAQHEMEFGDYGPGRFFFLTRPIRAVAPPIPCKGSLGLWNIPPELR